jgi:hypothetical protein
VVTELDADYPGPIELPYRDAQPVGMFLGWRELVVTVTIWVAVLAACWLPFILAGVWIYRRLHVH